MRRKTARKVHSQHVNAGEPLRRNTDEEILKHVRSGVEAFVLGHSTIQEFVRILNDVTDREKACSHPLTKTLFSGIVRDAIRKRNLRLKQ
ncbi:MAG: hypothetical protein OEV30_00760 [Ignavibacteria bacterium]|nr:hypothetical protein [Ignavibacteria bacterium]